MKVIVIIDEFLNETEFRNYSSYWLGELGFTNIRIEDPRLADSEEKNDNDILATKGQKEYTIQTFLNVDITEKELNETIEDMLKEHVDNGIIITNKKVSDAFRIYAKDKNVEIIDRKDLNEEL